MSDPLPSSITDLLAGLQSPQLTEQRHAADQLVSLGPAVCDPLFRLLPDTAPPLRGWLGYVLIKIRPVHAFYAALRRTERSERHSVTAADVALPSIHFRDRSVHYTDALREIPVPEAADLIVAAMRDAYVEAQDAPDPNPPYFTAVEQLTDIADRFQAIMPGMIQPIIPALTRALDDETAYIRCWAASTLGVSYNSQAIPPLLFALQDEDASVRGAAAWVLHWFPDPRVVTALIAALRDADASVREYVVWALGRLGDPRAYEPVRDVLQDRTELPKVRQWAAQTLSGLGDHRAVEVLLKCLTEPTPEVRLGAVLGLGRLHDVRAVPPLIALLQESTEDPKIRAKAIGSLGRLGDPQAIDAIAHAPSAIATLEPRTNDILKRLRASQVRESTNPEVE